MKQPNKTVTQILGLKQSDLALLLGVSRSQISMVNSGRRALPADASAKLAEILKAHHARASAKSYEGAIEAERRKQLQKLLDNNRYGQLYNERKIAALTLKLHASGNFAALAQSDLRGHAGKPAPKSAEKEPELAIIQSLVQFQIRLERQQQEQLWLESQLKSK